MFEIGMGVVVVAVVVLAYRLKKFDAQESGRRVESDRAADMCSRCEDYDCLVACQERRKAERRDR